MKAFFLILGGGIAAIIASGLFWFFFAGPAAPVGFGWYVFSFASGLTMIVLPCTLPLAFVIVPLSMGKGPLKGVGIAAAFGLGVTLTLSAYGILAALLGDIAIGTLGAPLETVKNWMYLFAGAAAYLFALGEIGLVRLRVPTYSGAMPAFIQKRQDYAKALLLGLFLGNIGVGCPHPATPVILTRIAASGDVFYGWLLFFVHAAGRVLPLLLLALLGIMGVNALAWLVARKTPVERATGWGMIFVAGFILVLGLFTHDWWVYSGQHTLFEEITREEEILGVVAQRLAVAPPHTHGIPAGTGLFGLPLPLGNWMLVGLWILPLFWYHFKKKKEEGSTPSFRLPFFTALSLLLAVTVISVLPDRFLHSVSDMSDAAHGPGMVSAEHPAPHEVAYHEARAVREGPTVFLGMYPPAPVMTGTSTRLEFFVNEQPDGTPISIDTLETDHTKFMHVIGARNDLQEFFHIHPEPTGIPGLLAVTHVFQKPGRYALWSEIKKDGVRHTFGHEEIAVDGVGEQYQKDVFFARGAIIGGFQVSLAYDEPIVAGREADIAFDVHDAAGRKITVEQYLGADMHLAVIRDDLRHLIHAHPDDTHSNDADTDHQGVAPRLIRALEAHGREEAASKGDETATFHVVFPEQGLYRLFAQFRPRGADLTADAALIAGFWVRVGEERPFARSAWWTYLFISAGLIAVLSSAVRRYLRESHE